MTTDIRKNASMEATCMPTFKHLLKHHISTIEKRLDKPSFISEIRHAQLVNELSVYNQLLDDYKYFKALKKDSRCVI